MSSAHGAGPTRKRPQKHKNSFAFKNNLHDKTPQMIRMNALNVSEVCQRCKAQIEWKIKYKKYKPLSQAKTCIRCNQRTVKKAYHVACKDCARAERCCAKCLKSAEEVEIEPPEPTPREEQRLKVEMDRLIKSLPERKRRTFVRFMKKGKEGENGDVAEEDETATTEADAADEDDGEAKVVRRKRIPHSRADLLNKIEALRIAEDDEGELGETDEENTDSEYDYEYSDDLDSDDLGDGDEGEEEEEKVTVEATKKLAAASIK